MDWDKLRIFHAVADAGSLTHAGEVLHLSQSAVSRQIRALEESLNTTLFHRHARGLILTEQGELLFDATSAMVKRLDAAAARIRDSEEEVFGELRVTTTTGFGTLVALDAETGARLWTQKTDAAVTGAPAVADGLVYVVGRDNRAWAVRAEDGRVQWQLPGTPSPSGMLGGAAPAVTDQLAVFPFGSSELVAVLRKSGLRVWGALISGQRRGRVYAQVKDITGDPVIADGVLYAGNQSGRLAAMRAANGERLWTAEEGTYSPVWPVAGAVFLISDQNELVRLDAETGARVWGVQLPYFTKKRVKRREAIFAHYGPVLAGGRLIVASDDGMLRFFDPATGAEQGTLALPGGAAAGSAPLRSACRASHSR